MTPTIKLSLVLISAALGLSSVSAQDHVVSYHDSIVTYTLVTRDSFYTINDTALVTVTIQNNSARNLFVFNVDAYYPSTISLDVPLANVNLGGNWWYDPGIERPVYLRRIDPNAKRVWQLRFVLSAQRIGDAKLSEYIRIPFTNQTNLVRFYIAYIQDPISDDQRTDTAERSQGTMCIGDSLEVSNNGHLRFPDNRAGDWFDRVLKRVTLGPLTIMVVNR